MYAKKKYGHCFGRMRRLSCFFGEPTTDGTPPNFSRLATSLASDVAWPTSPASLAVGKYTA